MGERVEVLVTVKTYPLPSKGYDETVCTAGVRADGSFIRLYPIDYRYKPWHWRRYRKYQWIALDVEKHPASADIRPESFRPIGKITPLKWLSTRNNWAERRQYVLAGGMSSMCALQRKGQSEVSLGIVKPALVHDLVAEEADRDWKPTALAERKQLKLFGPARKPLEKIPYKFSYKFSCDEDGCKGHRMMIEDWEVGQLYRSMRDKYRDEETACKLVREKFYGQMCADDINTHFFVGTVLQHGTWIILGVFWPKKEQ